MVAFAACSSLCAPAQMHGQSGRRPDSGHIDRSAETDEVGGCRRADGLD